MSARNARDLAYHTVRSRIITMELKPGDPLNDRELAEELGISRTPMREALILLNNAHMVAIKPQSGTHVAPIDLHLMELEQFSRYTLGKEILTSLQHVERIRKFSLQTNENKAVCAAHTRILDAMVQNDTQELSRALESHLSRYKQTVEEVQRLHPDYFTDGLEP